MGNAVRTENGIRYLGKRLARYILELTYPDQPVRYIKKRSISQKLTNSFRPAKRQDDDGVPTQEAARSQQEDESPDSLAYTFTSISFIGHSLGGLVQLCAIAYIQKHVPNFFEQIQPVNFVALATPFLGLSNENPMYVKFALDFGLVGRSGQDLGLTWRPPTLGKGGWSAVMGFGSSANKEEKEDDPGSKPLLRILPAGPAHAVLRKFRNRTVYSNVVNDGIVPLRTSCLLFLDWRGLDKVEKARRENGLVGRMLGWGWAEVTGQSLLPGGSGSSAVEGEILSDTEELSEEIERIKTTVPQPAVNAANEDDETQSIKSLREAPAAQGNEQPAVSPSTLESIHNFLRPTAKTTKKDLKMFQRSQTIASDQMSSGDRPESASASSSARPRRHRSRPAAAAAADHRRRRGGTPPWKRATKACTRWQGPPRRPRRLSSSPRPTSSRRRRHLCPGSSTRRRVRVPYFMTVCTCRTISPRRGAAAGVTARPRRRSRSASTRTRGGAMAWADAALAGARHTSGRRLGRARPRRPEAGRHPRTSSGRPRRPARQAADQAHRAAAQERRAAAAAPRQAPAAS